MHLLTCGVHLSVSYLFASLYCSWGSRGKNTEVVCHSLLQWITFCQTSPPWPVHLGWPHTAWLSFIELDKVVVRVIRLASCLWLWFQSICPLMPSISAYHLTWVSLNLDVGCLFTAAPAKHSRSSLPWMWGSSSRPLPVTSDVGCPHCASVAAAMVHKRGWEELPHVQGQGRRPRGATPCPRGFAEKIVNKVPFYSQPISNLKIFKGLILKSKEGSSHR